MTNAATPSLPFNWGLLVHYNVQIHSWNSLCCIEHSHMEGKIGLIEDGVAMDVSEVNWYREGVSYWEGAGMGGDVSGDDANHFHNLSHEFIH